MRKKRLRQVVTAAADGAVAAVEAYHTILRRRFEEAENMYGKIVCGTDGMRGVADKGLDRVLAYKLGQACALPLTDSAHHGADPDRKKTQRISGDMLESALVAGICYCRSNG